MVETSSIEINFQEGKIQDYYNTLKKQFGGELTTCNYLLSKGPFRTDMQSFDIVGELEMTLCEFESSKPLLINRTPDEDPGLIHINLILEGKYSQVYNGDLKHVEAGSTQGIFLYDGMFPIQAEFPPNVKLKWVAFKVKIPELQVLLYETQKVLKDLFEKDKAVAYHSALPVELEVLLNDLFKYRNLGFGKNPIIIAKGIEVYINLMNTIKSLLNDNTLTGLHHEDLIRLNTIKQKLISNLDQKITIEELVDEFGISISKLNRDFKQLYNTTIYQFYTLARMDEAFRRLKSGQYTVSEVGYDLGYQNLSKFSKMFKQVKGISPKEVIKLKKVL